jgi:ketosteroid isomerase-like protein
VPGEPSASSVLTAGYAAFNRRDADALRDLMVDDFRWNESEEVPGRKECKSAEEFAAYMMGFDLLWDEFSFEPVELRNISGDTTVARVLGRGRGKASRDEVVIEISHVWRFRDGKVARMDAFLDPDQALDAAAAPPPFD